MCAWVNHALPLSPPLDITLSDTHSHILHIPIYVPLFNIYKQVTLRDPRTNNTYTMDVPEDRYIFFAFEDAGIDLPFMNGKRMCRNGCCTTCAVKLEEGTVKMEAALGLLREMRKQNYALTCCSLPRSDIVCEMQDEDEVYVKQWGETFESGGVEWGGFLPEDD